MDTEVVGHDDANGSAFFGFRSVDSMNIAHGQVVRAPNDYQPTLFTINLTGGFAVAADLELNLYNTGTGENLGTAGAFLDMMFTGGNVSFDLSGLSVTIPGGLDVLYAVHLKNPETVGTSTGIRGDTAGGYRDGRWGSQISGEPTSFADWADWSWDLVFELEGTGLQTISNGTTYYYAVYATDDSQNYSSVSTTSATPADNDPPADVTGATFAPQIDGTSIDLHWINPSDEDFMGLVIARSESTIPGSPSDGTLVSELNLPPGVTMYVYGQLPSPYTDAGLTPDTAYFYKFFTYDEVYNYSAGVEVATTTSSDIWPPPDVANFTAIPGFAEVTLSWTNPTFDVGEGVRVVRKVGSAPANANDGAVVYQGVGEIYTDVGLDGNVTYYYTAFTYDDVPNYSAGVVADASGTTPYSSDWDEMLWSDDIGSPQSHWATEG